MTDSPEKKIEKISTTDLHENENVIPPVSEKEEPYFYPEHIGNSFWDRAEVRDE